MQTPLASSQLRHPPPTAQQLLVRVPTLPKNHHHTTEGEASVTKEEALAAIKLLSALESWAFSTKNLLPDYLHDDLCVTQTVLAKIVLKEKP
jgi:hypothetical protein